MRMWVGWVSLAKSQEPIKAGWPLVSCAQDVNGVCRKASLGLENRDLDRYYLTAKIFSSLSGQTVCGAHKLKSKSKAAHASLTSSPFL